VPELRDLIVYGFSGISLALYVYLLTRLLRGYLRSYFGLVLYLVVLTLTFVMDWAGYKSADRSTYFLISETVRWGALYLVVLTFVWKALSSQPTLSWIRHWLFAVSVLTVFVALYFNRNDQSTMWLVNTVNILSVAGMLLNLILWTLLLRYRNSDLTLFLVTSGLGIQAAMEAAAWSMRRINRPLFDAAYYVGILGHILCLLVWIMAFSRRPAKTPPANS
jgi:hypothetical protein